MGYASPSGFLAGGRYTSYLLPKPILGRKKPGADAWLQHLNPCSDANGTLCTCGRVFRRADLIWQPSFILQGEKQAAPVYHFQSYIGGNLLCAMEWFHVHIHVCDLMEEGKEGGFGGIANRYSRNGGNKRRVLGTWRWGFIPL